MCEAPWLHASSRPGGRPRIENANGRLLLPIPQLVIWSVGLERGSFLGIHVRASMSTWGMDPRLRPTTEPIHSISHPAVNRNHSHTQSQPNAHAPRKGDKNRIQRGGGPRRMIKGKWETDHQPFPRERVDCSFTSLTHTPPRLQQSNWRHSPSWRRPRAPVGYVPVAQRSRYPRFHRISPIDH